VGYNSCYGEYNVQNNPRMSRNPYIFGYNEDQYGEYNVQDNPTVATVGIYDFF
jgi:hypothetical protein